jgi:hypothetical protein
MSSIHDQADAYRSRIDQPTGRSEDVPVRAPRATALLWLIAPCALLFVLQHVGGSTAPSSLFHLHAWGTWLAHQDGQSVSIALARALAMLAGWYLVATNAVVLIAHASRARPLIALSSLVAPAMSRRVLRHALGASVIGVLSVSGPAMAAETPPTMFEVGVDDGSSTAGEVDGPPMLRHLVDDGAELGTTRFTSPSTTEAPPMLPPTSSTAPAIDPQPTSPPATAAPPSTTTSMAPPLRTEADDGPAATPTPAPASGDGPATPTGMWTIQTGENLWTIAHDVLVDRTGVQPDDDLLRAYWSSLVTANHDVLAHPDNPDLVFAGQVLTLPPSP